MEASLSKPWLSPRRAAPEPHPSFPGKTPEYEQRPHRLEKRVWGHLSDTVLAEVVLTQGLFWKLSVPLLELPLHSCSHCLFSCFLTTTTPRPQGDVQQQEWVTHRFLTWSRKDLITNSNCKAVSPAQPTHPAEYGLESSCRRSSPAYRDLSPGTPGRAGLRLRGANPPPPGLSAAETGLAVPARCKEQEWVLRVRIHLGLVLWLVF